jgi:hypothetical protein
MGIPEGTDMKPPAVYFIHRRRLLIFGLKQDVLFFNYVLINTNLSVMALGPWARGSNPAVYDFVVTPELTEAQAFCGNPSPDDVGIGPFSFDSGLLCQTHQYYDDEKILKGSFSCPLPYNSSESSHWEFHSVKY